MTVITQIATLPKDLPELALTAKKEGFKFLDRLVEDFATGKNRFDKTGETLFEVRDEGRLVAVGGLNIDPYTSNGTVGRVRRLYVDPDYRRDGIGTILMEAIERVARISFSELHLRTDTARGAQFYSRLGYKAVSHHEQVSHTKMLFSGQSGLVLLVRQHCPPNITPDLLASCAHVGHHGL